jgi:hypothetical protein
MERRRVFRLIAILFTMWALLDMSAAEARSPRPPRPPRRCHPGKVCRHGTGFCNDAGRCCDTMDGDVACGSNCCEFPTQACCDGQTCTDLTQNDNCGGCGIVCSGGRTCQDLVCTCPAGTTDCGGECVNTQSDDNNCGACGNACHGGESCQNGVCACPSGKTDCSGTCTDTNSDDANCGACGNACAADETCFAGRCGCPDATQLDCNGQCTDGFSDPNNCGRCGNVCQAGQNCVGGSCQAPCDACHERVNNVCVLKDLDKTLVCDGVCVDPKTDSANCGSCGNECLGGDTCQNGLCIGSACPAPQWHSCGTIGATTYCELQGTKCCIGAREATGCGDGTKCAANLDAYCCPADYKICGIWAGYPCVPADAQCPE